MKICWDNLEKLKWVEGKFKHTKYSAYFEIVENCPVCGEEFLGRTNKNGKSTQEVCSKSCTFKRINSKKEYPIYVFPVTRKSIKYLDVDIRS